MMKKFIAAILSSALLISLFVPAFAAEETTLNMPKYIYQNETFDAYVGANVPPEGWTFYSVGEESVISDAQVKGSVGKSVKMYNNIALDTNMTKVFSNPITGQFILEAKFLAEDYNVNRFLFSAKSSSGNGFSFFQITGDGKIKSGDFGFPYKLKKWYTIAAAVDTAAHTYDVYINGQLKEKGLAVDVLSDFAQYKNYVKGSPGAKSTFYMDDVRIYSGSELFDIKDNSPNAAEGTPEETSTDAVSDSSIKLIKRGVKEDYIPTQGEVFEVIGKGSAYFLGNANVFVNQKRTKLDESNDGIVPFIRNGQTVVPAEFATKQLGVDVSDLTITNGAVPLRTVANKLGQFVYWDDRGLIVLTEKENPFDPVKDSFLIDEILKLLIYERPTEAQIVADLKKNSSHPRVMATKETFDNIRANVKSNEYVKKMVEEVSMATENFINEPPIEYAIPDGRRLKVEKEIKVRLKNLALMWQVTGDEKYAKRAWEELKCGANFPDWNDTREFLNTSGMMEGFAIAYDWMYDYWNEEQKAIIRNAIVEKGIKKGLAQQESGAWWLFSYPFVSNWTAVCNGGLVIATMAVGDEIDPAVTGKVVKNAMTAVEDSLLMEYAPDGGWGEGPGYWNYTISYLTIMLSSLHSACGTTYGLIDTPGLSETAYFPINLVGPTGSFNFGDAGIGTISAPEQFFMADMKKDDALAGVRLAVMVSKPVKATVEDVIWFNPDVCDYNFIYSMESLEKDKYYRGIEAIMLRSGWDDKNTINFLAFKGGNAWGSHRHLDAGNFVIDALGQRWASDLGSDDYGLTGYFNYDKERFQYLRMAAEGHNILLFSPKNEDSPTFPQELGEIAKITEFVSKPKGAYGIMDLTKTYKSYVTDYKRGFMLGNYRSSFVIQDELQTKNPCDITWQMFTKADVEIFSSGKSIMLTQGKQKMFVSLSTTEDVKFEVASAAPAANSLYASKQNKNIGYKKLIVKFKDVSKLNFAVNFIPLKADERAPLYPPTLVPMSDWHISDGEIIYPKINEINIDGAALAEFDQKRYSYTVSLPNETKEIPQVSAKGNQTVTVTQAQTIPGTATISIVNDENKALATNYYINFKKLPKDVDLSKLEKLKIASYKVSAEPQKENPAASMMDGDIATRWSAEGEQWAEFDLGSLKTVSVIGIAFYGGDTRTFNYTLQYSEDGVNWYDISSGESSGSTSKEEMFTFDPVGARFIRILGHGNSQNTWNSYSEVNIYGTN